MREISSALAFLFAIGLLGTWIVMVDVDANNAAADTARAFELLHKEYVEQYNLELQQARARHAARGRAQLLA